MVTIAGMLTLILRRLLLLRGPCIGRSAGTRGGGASSHDSWGTPRGSLCPENRERGASRGAVRNVYVWDSAWCYQPILLDDRTYRFRNPAHRSSESSWRHWHST